MKTNRLISLLLCLCMVATLFTGFAETASAEDYITYTVKNGDNLYTLVGKMGMNYGTVKYVIMALNGFTNEAQLSQLQPGQTILLPTSNQAAASLASKALTTTTTTTTTAAAATTTTATTGTATATGTSSSTSSTSTYQGYTASYYLVEHTVAKGETLISICKSLGTNYYDYEKTVLKINNMTSANSLKVGQTIWVPAKTGSAGGTIAVVAHSVKNGETISGICAAYGTSYGNYKAAVKAVNNKIANVEKLNVGQTVYIPVYTTWNNAVAGNPSTAAGTSGSPTTNIATGYAIGFTVPASAKYGNPFAIVGGSSNVSRASAGQTVIVRPNAYTGYAVKSIKVVRTDSNAHVQMNDYAFTMPNSNVQITIEYAAGKNIKKMPSSHGTFDTMVYGELSTTAFYGDKVEIVPYPDAGYEVANVNVLNVDTGNPVVRDVDSETGIYYFTMPNAEVRVTVTFRVATSIKLYYNRGFDLGYGIVQFYINGVQVTEANQGDTVRMVIIPGDGWIIDTNTNNDANNRSVLAAAAGIAAGTRVQNPNFNTVNNPYGNVQRSSYIAVKNGATNNVDDITKINDYTYEFKIPVAGSTVPTSNVPVSIGRAVDPEAAGNPLNPRDVNVYVGFKQRTPYGLFAENLSGKIQYGTVTFTVTDPITGEIRKNAEYAFEGDIVELVPYAAPSAEVIGGTTATGRVLSYTYNADGTATGGYGGTNEYVTLVPSGSTLPNARWTPGRVGYEFTMPASAVNVEAQFYNAGNAATDYRGIAYDVVVADNAHGKIEILDAAGNKVNQAIPGTTLTIRITADKGYRVQRQKTLAYNPAPGNTEYGVYVNFNDNTGDLIPLVDGMTIFPYTTAVHCTNTNPAALTETTNATGNAVLQFDITTPRFTSGTNISGVPIAITALYETYSASYTDTTSTGTVNTTGNKVTLRAVNIDASTGAAYFDGGGAGRSINLDTPISGASGLSNIEMYVNGVLVPEGTEVAVGTTVGFRFTVREDDTVKYKLDSVWKRANNFTSGGFDQQLSPVDGIYWYTVTEKDADAIPGGGATPSIWFVVITEPVAQTQYTVLYSTNAGSFGIPAGAQYELQNVTAGGAWTPGDIMANEGDTIALRIPNWATFGEGLSNVRLTRVTVGNMNLTMGDLSPLTGGPFDGWTYTFVMPKENVKTEVYYEETQLIDLY